MRRTLVATLMICLCGGGAAMASSMTQVFKVSIACNGQAKFYDTVETAQRSQALEIMKRRYPGCAVYIEGTAKRVSPKH
jgi:hypoxanthine phosphoribosyltransferase